MYFHLSQPTNKPSAKPSLSPTTMRPTTRSPISEMWWPDVESEEKTCYYGRGRRISSLCSLAFLLLHVSNPSLFFFMLDYPEFMTLNSNRLNFLFTSKEECCRVHSCIVSTRADYWWPALETDEKQCSYGSGINIMVLSTFVFVIFGYISNILLYLLCPRVP